MNRYIRLGVNIDHVATIREARGTFEPSPVQAAYLVERGGADAIVMHLREDRRHIQDEDLEVINRVCHLPINMEMASTDEMIEIASSIKPMKCTLVPEKREELTTEGGLDVVNNYEDLKTAVKTLQNEGIVISLFIDPDKEQIKASADLEVEEVELHTGEYANALTEEEIDKELSRLIESAESGDEKGLIIAVGHGLTYQNVRPVAQIPEVVEMNIGHSIVSRSVFTGIERAVREMIEIMRGCI